MRFSIKYLTAFMLLSLATSCGNQNGENEEQSQETDLKTATMSVHDAAMTEYAELKTAQRELAEYLAATDSLAKPELYGKAKEALQAAKDADEAMMGWMGAFKKPDPSMPEAEQQAYYLTEKTKIALIALEMEKARVLAKRVLAH